MLSTAGFYAMRQLRATHIAYLVHTMSYMALNPSYLMHDLANTCLVFKKEQSTIPPREYKEIRSQIQPNSKSIGEDATKKKMAFERQMFF